MLALPFCNSTAAYLICSKAATLTGWTKYLDYIVGNRPRGAGVFGLSHYWTFISRETYLSNEFKALITTAMLGVNVLYFFGKFNGFPKCWSNLLNTFSQEEHVVTLRSKICAINVMTVCYFGTG